MPSSHPWWPPRWVILAPGARDRLDRVSLAHRHALRAQVFYYLGELDSALSYALGAGSLFDVNDQSEYVQTLVGAYIGQVAARRWAGWRRCTPPPGLLRRCWQRVATGAGPVPLPAAGWGWLCWPVSRLRPPARMLLNAHATRRRPPPPPRPRPPGCCSPLLGPVLRAAR